MDSISTTSYVCAFRGRRDAYAVPLALAESGRLDQFITDAWAGPLLRKLPFAARYSNRWEPGIPGNRVSCLWGGTVREHARHAMGYSKAETWARLDSEFSLASAARARKTGANLFLYSPYAFEAFTASYPGRLPRRVMFQFHPHAVVEKRLLDADLELFPEMAHSHAEETGGRLPEHLQRRNADGWRHADLIVCASSFTRDSLLEVGADIARCVVIPYGVNVPPLRPEYLQESPGSFRALFVGSGIQRKGIHHLLRAWERARLPQSSELVLVCRVMDPGLEERVARTPGVKLLRGIGATDLGQLYAESSLFVLPSLTEGFGQVFLEALALGCPVLGTSHTALPDLGTEADGVFLTPAGDIDELTARLEELAERLPSEKRLRERARTRAKFFSWERFRAELREIL